MEMAYDTTKSTYSRTPSQDVKSQNVNMDYDSMGDFSRFGKPKTKNPTKKQKKLHEKLQNWWKSRN